MKNLHVLLVVALAALFAASCCPCRKAKAPQSKSIVNTKWELVELQGKPVVAHDNFFLMFNAEENRVSGRGDCNSLAGSYTSTEAGKLQMTHVASTRMFCPNQSEEDAFMQMLETIDSFKIDGDLLMLLSKGKLIAILKATPQE